MPKPHRPSSATVSSGSPPSFWRRLAGPAAGPGLPDPCGAGGGSLQGGGLGADAALQPHRGGGGAGGQGPLDVGGGLEFVGPERDLGLDGLLVLVGDEFLAAQAVLEGVAADLGLGLGGLGALAAGGGGGGGHGGVLGRGRIGSGRVGSGRGRSARISPIIPIVSNPRPDACCLSEREPGGRDPGGRDPAGGRGRALVPRSMGLRAGGRGKVFVPREHWPTLPGHEDFAPATRRGPRGTGTSAPRAPDSASTPPPTLDGQVPPPPARPSRSGVACRGRG